MIARLMGAAAIAALTAPAAAQDHGGHMMPGMAMPAPTPAKRTTTAPRPQKTKPRRKTTAKPTKPMMPPAGNATHEGHDMTGMSPEAAMPVPMTGGHEGHDMSGMANTPMDPGTGAMPMAMTGTALMPGNALPPAPPKDHYADRDFPIGVMDASRQQMMRENGGQAFHQILFNLAEAQIRNGRDGYRWDGEGWFGGDIDRAVVKSEGSGAFGGPIEAAEVQALYSRAIGPYFDLQAGVRHDIAPTPTRTYATVGVEGLAPYMFDVEAAAFLSTRGELLGRLEGWYDQRLTQRLVLQPRIELNLSAQDMPDIGTGSGLVNAELGLRLRYELAREFAPYVGVSYEAKAGRTADFARAASQDVTSTSLVVGVRFWF